MHHVNFDRKLNQNFALLFTFGPFCPTVWNALHVELRAPELCIESFRKKLGTYLFTSSD